MPLLLIQRGLEIFNALQMLGFACSVLGLADARPYSTILSISQRVPPLGLRQVDGSVDGILNLGRPPVSEHIVDDFLDAGCARPTRHHHRHIATRSRLSPSLSIKTEFVYVKTVVRRASGSLLRLGV